MQTLLLPADWMLPASSCISILLLEWSWQGALSCHCVLQMFPRWRHSLQDAGTHEIECLHERSFWCCSPRGFRGSFLTLLLLSQHPACKSMWVPSSQGTEPWASGSSDHFHYFPGLCPCLDGHGLKVSSLTPFNFSPQWKVSWGADCVCIINTFQKLIAVPGPC